MSTSVMQNQRLVELLVQRAIDGLSSAERAELKRLLAEDDYVDAGRFEYTAAALLLAGDVEREELPDDLRNHLLVQAQTSVDIPPGIVTARSLQEQEDDRIISIVGRARQQSGQAAASSARNRGDAVRPERPSASQRAPSWQSKTGWFAAAASVLIAVAGWWPRLQSEGGDVEVPVVAKTIEQQREELLARQGVVRRSWQPTKDRAAKGLTGDVVWDPGKQEGYVRFRGLQANNAQELQYQLWIFDATRDDKYPVDAGVFDVPAGKREVIIPIRAKLAIRDAAAFAVTIEQPGGSVVSTRDRVVALAPVAAG